MNFWATLKIEGENCLGWIKENEETGLLEIYFDTEEGEIILNFEPLCFDTLVAMIHKFTPTSQKSVRNPFHSKGRVKPDVSLYIDEEKVTMEVEMGDLREDIPVIKFACRRGEVCIGFNKAQAKALKECCEKIIDINEKSREVQKEKTIPAPSA